MKNSTFIYPLFFSLLLCAGCDVINPPEEIPAYLHITNFTVNTSVGEGTNSSNIVDAYLFVDGSFLGVYTLPATLPILNTGLTRLDVFPGIKDNGIDSTPEIYPFYSVYQLDVDLVSEETDTIQPVTGYVDDLKFTIREGFENTLQIFRDDIDGDDQTTIELTETEVFEGTSSAKIVLSDENPILQVGSTRFTDLPLGSQGVYLELDYKTEVPFEVGIYYYDQINTRIADFQHGVNVKTEWNKVYINMTPEFTGLVNIPDLKDFQIGFRSVMDRDDSGNYLEGTREIFLDNIKLIHY